MRALATILIVCAAAGCGTAAPRGPAYGIGKAKVFLAPIADENGHLSASERAWLRGAFALDLIALGRAGRQFDLVSERRAADVVFEVAIERFVEARPWLALIVGLGAGRPGYEAEVAIAREGDGALLARAHLERDRAAFAKDERGTRAAMLAAIAGEIARFARRHR